MAEIPTVVIISDPNMGDSICAMHAAQIIARDRKVIYLQSMHPEVELLMRPLNAKTLSEIPKSELMHVKHLSIHNCFRDWGGRMTMSPVRHYLREAGLPYAPNIPIPYGEIDLLIAFDYQSGRFKKPEVPRAGLVIAPFTQDRGRLWPLRNWQDVIDELVACDVDITIVGSKGDPQPWDEVEYYYGQPLSSVGYMMREAQYGVLTIDSGPSRLAQVVQAPNHVVLSPSIYPEAWVAGPESTQVRSLGPRPEWDKDEVVNAVLRGIRS